jgi:hypothetical protein
MAFYGSGGGEGNIGGSVDREEVEKKPAPQKVRGGINS